MPDPSLIRLIFPEIRLALNFEAQIAVESTNLVYQKRHQYGWSEAAEEFEKAAALNKDAAFVAAVDDA